jgi:hypothetical protein
LLEFLLFEEEEEEEKTAETTQDFFPLKVKKKEELMKGELIRETKEGARVDRIGPSLAELSCSLSFVISVLLDSG